MSPIALREMLRQVEVIANDATRDTNVVVAHIVGAADAPRQ